MFMSVKTNPSERVVLGLGCAVPQNTQPFVVLAFYRSMWSRFALGSKRQTSHSWFVVMIFVLVVL
jgi:hypothetical protein